MSAPQTVPTGSSVADFIAGIADDGQRADCERLCGLMRDATGFEPALWGPSIVGFGHHHYRYASGREGDTFLVGFSPRARNLTLYLTGGLDAHEGRLARLGTHKTGKGCLYLRRLSDANESVLVDLIRASAAALNPES